MSTNIIAILLGILIIAVFLGYRVRWKKKQEKFREELIERFGQEDEHGQENESGQKNGFEQENGSGQEVE